MADGTAREFDGSLEDYRDQVLRAGNGKGEGGPVPEKVSRKDKRKASADARERNKGLRKQAARAEAEMQKLWQKREEIDARLAMPDAAGEASQLMKERGDIERDLIAAESRWLEASEAVEAAKLDEVDA